MNTIIQIISFGFLLIGSFYFGYVGRPTEMGLSIAAAALALAFCNIDKIRKFKGAGFEAEMRDKMEAIVAKESEPTADFERLASNENVLALSETRKDILKCLGNSKYTWRTIIGVAREAKLARKDVLIELRQLTEDGLAMQWKEGVKSSWALSKAGRNFYNSLVETSTAEGK